MAAGLPKLRVGQALSWPFFYHVKIEKGVEEMKKLLMLAMILGFVAGAVYAAEEAVSVPEPVSTVLSDTGKVITTAAEGTAETLDIGKNNPVTTAVETTGKVAVDSVKTVTFQEIDEEPAEE